MVKTRKILLKINNSIIFNSFNQEILLMNNKQEYDAIVIGTGVSGGWAAKEL